MKSEKLLWAIGDIDESLAADAMNLKKGKRKKLYRVAAVAAAAALALTLTVSAGAVDALVDSVFSPAFSGADSEALDLELLHRMGAPVGASAVDNNVTITLDSVIRDRYNVTAVFTVGGAKAKELRFDDAALTIGGMTYQGASGSGKYAPDEDDMFVVLTWSEKEPIPDGTAEIVLENITGYPHRAFLERHIPGKWVLDFDVPYEDMTVEMGQGQTFAVNGMEGTIDQFFLSPLSIRMDFTVRAEEGALEESPEEQPLMELDMVITKKDGTKLYSFGHLPEEEHGGFDSSWMDTDWADGQLQCQYGALFDQPVPLEEIDSIIIGGTEIYRVQN